jgi:hypothetical protein
VKLSTVQFAILILLITQCTQYKTEHSHDNEFYAFLDNLPETKPANVYQINLSEINVPLYEPFRFIAVSEGRIVVADGTNETIHLISAGGRGEGPGEFQLINQLEAGIDNRLYVYDKRSARVTFFDITDDKFRFAGVRLVPANELLRLDTIHEGVDGLMGVFLTGNFYEDNRPFHVYSLSDQLETEGLLIELPSNELIKIEFNNNIFYRPIHLGLSTLWHVNDGNFYYTQSDQFSVSKLNNENLEQIKIEVPDIPPNLNSDSLKEKLLSDFREPIRTINPEMGDYIRTAVTMPAIRAFLVKDGYIYYNIFNSNSDKNGKVLIVNKETKEMSILNTPPRFGLFSVRDKKLFGMSFSGEEYPVVIIQL